jgi:hypothetical protein
MQAVRAYVGKGGVSRLGERVSSRRRVSIAILTLSAFAAVAAEALTLHANFQRAFADEPAVGMAQTILLFTLPLLSLGSIAVAGRSLRPRSVISGPASTERYLRTSKVLLGVVMCLTAVTVINAVVYCVV